MDAKEDESVAVIRYLSDLTAHYTEDKLEIKIFRKCSLMRLEETPFVDLAIMDVTQPGALEKTGKIRNQFSEAEILLIADESVSPMKYMRPSIRASSLLLRPMDAGWKQAIRDFFDQMLLTTRRESMKNVLWIESRDGAFRIPFDQIYYVEAREKKVFIRLRTEEFGVSGVLEKFSGKLPENFRRCHRSFIVNTDYIFRVRLSENTLYLKDGLFVPVSRSYKEAFKNHADEG